MKEQPTELSRNSKVATRPSRASEDLKASQEQCEKLKTENEQLKVKVEKLAFHLREFIDKSKQEEENKNKGSSSADDERKAQLLLLRDKMTSMKEEIASKDEENAKLKKIVEALKAKLTTGTTTSNSPTSLTNSASDLPQTLSRHARHDSPTTSSTPTSTSAPNSNPLKNSASDLIRSIENRNKSNTSTVNSPSINTNNSSSNSTTTATPTVAVRGSSSKVAQRAPSQTSTARPSSPHKDKLSLEAKRMSTRSRDSVHSSRHISAEALPDQLAAKPQFPSKGMANKYVLLFFV